MNKNQYIAIGAAVVLFLVLFFGFDTVPAKQKDLEKSRSLSFETTSIANLMNETKNPELDQEHIQQILQQIMHFTGLKNILNQHLNRVI
mgnify:CR=1 FL=1